MIAGDIHVWLITMETSGQQMARQDLDGNAVEGPSTHIAMVDGMRLTVVVDLRICVCGFVIGLWLVYGISLWFSILKYYQK